MSENIKIILCSSLFFSCGNNFPENETVEFSSTDISQDSFDNSNDSEHECSKNYNCFDDEICFENECYASNSLIYEITILEFRDYKNPCKNFQYTTYVDKHFDNFTEYTSQVSKCGGSWPNENTKMNGDQIFYLMINKIEPLHIPERRAVACSNGNYFHVIHTEDDTWYDEKCKPWTSNIFRYENFKFDVLDFYFEINISPVGSLQVDLFD